MRCACYTFEEPNKPFFNKVVSYGYLKGKVISAQHLNAGGSLKGLQEHDAFFVISA